MGSAAREIHTDCRESEKHSLAHIWWREPGITAHSFPSLVVLPPFYFSLPLYGHEFHETAIHKRSDSERRDFSSAMLSAICPVHRTVTVLGVALRQVEVQQTRDSEGARRLLMRHDYVPLLRFKDTDTTTGTDVNAIGVSTVEGGSERREWAIVPAT